jgi:hypothetical protein
MFRWRRVHTSRSKITPTDAPPKSSESGIGPLPCPIAAQDECCFSALPQQLLEAILENLKDDMGRGNTKVRGVTNRTLPAGSWALWAKLAQPTEPSRLRRRGERVFYINCHRSRPASRLAVLQQSLPSTRQSPILNQPQQRQEQARPSVLTDAYVLFEPVGYVLRDWCVQELACSWACAVLQGQLGCWSADCQRPSHTAPSTAHNAGELRSTAHNAVK